MKSDVGSIFYTEIDSYFQVASPLKCRKAIAVIVANFESFLHVYHDIAERFLVGCYDDMSRFPLAPHLQLHSRSPFIF